ncbi:hypothetical protein G6F56_008350 [Rhizopus delemar]|nr:hypothetical protein G6F56_008350 [Rhizopus delemar]
MYNSITTTIRNFMVRPGFTESLVKWQSREEVPGRYMDIYDGAVWKTFKTDPANSVPFVEESPYNLMMTLNVDWFQPYRGTQHSSGAIYLTIQNLPRDQRNLRKNVLLVGLIPGPSETKIAEISYFLDPMVNELLELQHGVEMQTYSQGVVRVKAVLSLVGCDLPAAKKVSGFTAINSKNACHKCHMHFAACPGHPYKRNFANFNIATWVPRTNEMTRQEAEKWLNASPSERLFLEAENGTRWTALHRLPYFDAARFTIIDPMHNLFLGTCLKMVRIWTANAYTDDVELITKTALKTMKVAGEKIILPPGEDCGPIIGKMENGKGFSGLKADEWRVWCHSLSPVLLKGHLPTKEFDHWMLFVDATRLLCQPSITEEDLSIANNLLLQFCSEMATIYAVHKVMSNMHFHMHLKQGILDYGPIYAYWLFNFERYNGDIKMAETNRKGAIERTFSRVFLKKVYLEDYLRSIPSLDGPINKQLLFDIVTKNTKNGRSSNDTYEELKSISDKHYELTSFLTSQKQYIPFGFEPLPLGTIASIGPPVFKTSIDADHYTFLFQYYQHRYTSPFAHHINTYSPFAVSNKIEKIKSLSILGQTYNSAACRSEKGTYIRARPLFQAGDGLVSGQVLYFFQHELPAKDANGNIIKLIHTFALVQWFKSYGQVFPSYKKRGLEVWRNEFCPLDKNSILPVSRIYSPVGLMKWLPEENLNVVIPLPQKIIG